MSADAMDIYAMSNPATAAMIRRQERLRTKWATYGNSRCGGFNGSDSSGIVVGMHRQLDDAAVPMPTRRPAVTFTTAMYYPAPRQGLLRYVDDLGSRS